MYVGITKNDAARFLDEHDLTGGEKDPDDQSLEIIWSKHLKSLRPI
jgi:hypothetical protein